MMMNAITPSAASPQSGTAAISPTSNSNNNNNNIVPGRRVILSVQRLLVLSMVCVLLSNTVYFSYSNLDLHSEGSRLEQAVLDTAWRQQPLKPLKRKGVNTTENSSLPGDAPATNGKLHRTSTSPSPSSTRPRNFHHHLHPDDEDGFSACLLISEDNHYLIEWLAYHYWFLPLRRLIVAVDPASRTSPHAILNRYASRGLMEITLWNDTDVFGPQTSNGTHDTTVTTPINNIRRLGADGAGAGPDVSFRSAAASSLLDQVVKIPPKNPLLRHRLRQSLVFSKCVAQLRLEQEQEHHHRTWVALLDTDEYITVHSGANEEYRIQQQHQNQNQSTTTTTTNPTTLYRILNTLENSNPRMLLHNTSCINVRRDQMSSEITPTMTMTMATMTNGSNTSTLSLLPWNTSQFNTLQFRHRAHYYQVQQQQQQQGGGIDTGNTSHNMELSDKELETIEEPEPEPEEQHEQGDTLPKKKKKKKKKPNNRRRSLAGKCLVHAGRIAQEEWLRYDRVGPHRPTLACPQGKTRIPPYQASLIVHHYPGTFAQFSFRQSSDPRQGVKDWARYEELSHLKHAAATDDLPQTWVAQFVQGVGLELGQSLLAGIGTVESSVVDKE
jgi:hypothetical protein